MKSYYPLIIIVVFLFTSCLVLHSGSVSSGPLLSAQASYVDMAKGKSKSVFMLGFGDLDNEDLVLQAKKNLYLSRPLLKDEYYSNFTTGFTNKYIVFGAVHVCKVTVSADVIKSDPEALQPFGDDFKNKLRPPLLRTDDSKTAQKLPEAEAPGRRANGNIIIAGDSVYYSTDSRNYTLFYVSSVEKETVLLIATNKTDKNILVPSEHLFFIKNIELDGFKSDQKVMATIQGSNNSTTSDEGQVMGISNRGILVKTSSGFYVLPSAKLKKATR